jgi:hypothetical protein
MEPLKTVTIKNSQYVEVKERIRYFREAPEYKGWSLLSEILEITDNMVRMRGWVVDEKGTTRATGHAFEDQSEGYINKTSYLENCETSAWGRALGNLGIGINAAVASADEIDRAEKKREKMGQADPFTRAGSLIFDHGKYSKNPKNVSWVFDNDMSAFNAAVDDEKCPKSLNAACIYYADAIAKMKREKEAKVITLTDGV